MRDQIQAGRRAPLRIRVLPIRRTLLKPAARWYLNKRKIEADYAAAVARQQSPVQYRDMVICIGPYDSIPDDV